MGKKRRKFEQEVLDRLQSIEAALAALSLPALPQQIPAPIIYGGYTCACGTWVPFGQMHSCFYWSSPNTCEVKSIASERPDLKVV